LAARRRPTAHAVALAAAAVLAGAGGCGGDDEGDPLQVADVLQAATPATSPQATVRPAGRVLTLDAAASAIVVDPATRTLAVAVTSPDRLLLFDLASLDSAPRTMPLPGAVEQLDLGAPGELLAPVRAAKALLRIDIEAAEPTVRTVQLDGHPAAAATIGDRTVVAMADQVQVLAGDTVVHTVAKFEGAADVVAVGGRAAVLDRLRTALFTIDPATGDLGPGLRAGNGATNSVGDRFGRVLVTDTRDGELLAFTADPMIMRQRYPVPGAPYAIAYDAARDLAWVTLTERNEVVGFDVAGGEPVERYRMATVRQPNAVAVDSDSGTVIVASGTGEGIQVVQHE